MPLNVEPPDRSRFATCRVALDELDATQLAAAAGALSLLPAYGIACGGSAPWRPWTAERPSGGRPLGQKQLRDLLAAGDLADMADMQDDPCDDVLTKS